GRAAEIGDVGEVAQPVVARLGIEYRRDDVGGDAGDDESVAVGLGCRARLRAHDAACAAAVFNEELFAEGGGEVVGNDPAERVGGAAGGERRDDPDRPVRPVLRLRRGAGEAGECRGGEDYCAKSQHEHDRRLANVPPTLAQVQTPVMARWWAATN